MDSQLEHLNPKKVLRYKQMVLSGILLEIQINQLVGKGLGIVVQLITIIILFHMTDPLGLQNLRM